VYKRARYYDPNTGEFISRDPLGYVDGMSLYRGYFVPNGVDPEGLACQEDCPERNTELFFQNPASGKSTLGPVQIETVEALDLGKCGEFSWTIQWMLKKGIVAGKKGGYILQHINYSYFVSDCDGNDISGDFPRWRSWWQFDNGFEFWEAWGINPGQNVTKYAEKGDKRDDTFGNVGPGKCTKGSIVVTGTYGFVNNAAIPLGMKPVPGLPSKELPATLTDPKVNMGITRSHDIMVTWDCCPEKIDLSPPKIAEK